LAYYCIEVDEIVLKVRTNRTGSSGPMEGHYVVHVLANHCKLFIWCQIS